LVYANPAARWESKFWRIDHWAKLADHLLAEGVRVVFGGAPGDAEHIGSITAEMSREPAIAAGRLSLSESVALLEASDVYVGVDSGPMHIAAFTDTSVVAVFGPTDPARVGPYGTGHRVLRAEGLDCLGCRKRSCDRMTCMKRVTAAAVLDETMRAIDSRRVRGRNGARGSSAGA
jgi:ADP-heptose:LPS heptosyltransferase